MQTTPLTLLGVVGGGTQETVRKTAETPPGEFEDTFNEVSKSSETESVAVGKEASRDGQTAPAILLDLLRLVLSQPVPPAQGEAPAQGQIGLAIDRRQAGIQLQGLVQEAFERIPGGRDQVIAALKNVQAGIVSFDQLAEIQNLVTQAFRTTPQTAIQVKTGEFSPEMQKLGERLAGLLDQMAAANGDRAPGLPVSPRPVPKLPPGRDADSAPTGNPNADVPHFYRPRREGFINFIHDHKDPFGQTNPPANGTSPFVTVTTGPVLVSPLTGPRIDPREPIVPVGSLPPADSNIAVDATPSPAPAGLTPPVPKPTPAPLLGFGLGGDRAVDQVMDPAVKEAFAAAKAQILGPLPTELKVDPTTLQEMIPAPVNQTAAQGVSLDEAGVDATPAPASETKQPMATDRAPLEKPVEKPVTEKPARAADELLQKGRPAQRQEEGERIAPQTSRAAHTLKENTTLASQAWAAISELVEDDKGEMTIEGKPEMTTREVKAEGANQPQLVKNELPLETRVNQPQFVKSIGEQMAERIEQMIAHQKPGKVVIRLTPEDLGTITLAVKSTGMKMDVEVQASNDSVRQALVTHKQDLVQTVESRGHSMSSFNVGQDNQSQMNQQSQQQAQNMRETFEQSMRLSNMSANERAVAQPVATARHSSQGLEIRA